MMNAEVTAENNPAYTIPLDSFYMPHEPVTHEDQRSVQVLVVLLDEVPIVLVRFPLVLVIKLRTGSHCPARYGWKIRRQSPIQRFLDPNAGQFRRRD